MKKLVIPALALVTAFAVMQPSEADAQRWRGGGWGRGGGGAVAAGVGLGFLGGALVAGAASRPYYGPGPYYAAPAYGEPVYVAPRRCWVERRPLVDEYGEVVAFRRQRVCG